MGDYAFRISIRRIPKYRLNVDDHAPTISAIDGSIMNRLKFSGGRIMNTDIDKEVLRLGRNHNLSLHGADGSCMHVHWGKVWVTRNGDIKDYIVDAGQSLAIDRAGTTLVSAVSDAGLSILQRCAGDKQRVPADIHVAQDCRADGGEVTEKSFDLVYPSVTEIDRHVARAKQLRAQFFARALQRVWNAARGIFVMSRTA